MLSTWANAASIFRRSWAMCRPVNHQGIDHDGRAQYVKFYTFFEPEEDVEDID
jgi:hypothetical protein